MAEAHKSSNLRDPEISLPQWNPAEKTHTITNPYKTDNVFIAREARRGSLPWGSDGVAAKRQQAAEGGEFPFLTWALNAQGCLFCEISSVSTLTSLALLYLYCICICVCYCFKQNKTSLLFGGTALKNIYFSSREPEVVSPYPCWVSHKPPCNTSSRGTP